MSFFVWHILGGTELFRPVFKATNLNSHSLALKTTFGSKENYQKPMLTEGQCVGSGIIEVFDTGSIGRGVRAL